MLLHLFLFYTHNCGTLSAITNLMFYIISLSFLVSMSVLFLRFSTLDFRLGKIVD